MAAPGRRHRLRARADATDRAVRTLGLGSAQFTHLAFKGGWGPEPEGYGVRQTGVIGTGDKTIVVSIAADPATSFATGQLMLDQIAVWLRGEIRFVARPAGPCPA